MRWLRRAAPLFAMLLMVAVIVLAIRERYDPYLVLYLDDIVRPKPAPIDVLLTEQLTLRGYFDTRPHTGKVASLQKGLVLMNEDRELIEEGFGFGLPIIVVGDVAHLSRHAAIAVERLGDQVKLIKKFRIDVADRPTRFLQVKYQDVESLGAVVFTYTIKSPRTIDVEVDFTGLDVAWDRAYLMNEQGAVNFPTYMDAKGEKRTGDDIGRWHSTLDAIGCWLSQNEKTRFCVKTEPGRHKFVGRERYNQYRWTGVFSLSWSGIDIEIGTPQPKYDYSISVEVLP